jgi:hypothetical protein
VSSREKMSSKRIALFTLILILFSDIVVRLNSFIGASNGSTELVAVLNLVSAIGLMMLIYRVRWKLVIPKNALLVYSIFMAWSAFSFAMGAINAKDYWDWKILLLNYMFTILIPLAIVMGLNYKIFAGGYEFIIKRLFLYGFLMIPFSLASDFELYPRIVIAVGLFILFIPYVNFKSRILIILVSAVSIFMDVSYRINTLRIVFALGLLVLYYARNFISSRSINVLVIILSVFPLVLLYMGIGGQFNVFTDNPFDYSVKTGNVENLSDTNLADDTRTFLYKEVFYSMIQKDSSFIIGEGGGSAYKSYYFADSDLNDRGRYGSEVGFLNTLLYSGALGVFFYALVLFSAAYYGVNHSKNYLCKMLGIFLAGHWLFFFVEDITKFDLNFFFIWLSVGLCFSKQFRALTDFDIKCYFKM